MMQQAVCGHFARRAARLLLEVLLTGGRYDSS